MNRLRTPEKLSLTTQNMIPTIGFPKRGYNTSVLVWGELAQFWKNNHNFVNKTWIKAIEKEFET